MVPKQRPLKQGERYFSLRGFDFAPVLRDGFRVTDSLGFAGFAELSNIEQVEVLKGPASILAGFLEPGGVINLVSERPLSEPTYEFGVRFGNRELAEPSIDFTGPLTDDGAVAYRVNAVYRNEDYYRSDFEVPLERYFIAPMLSFAIGNDTDLIVELEHRRDNRPFDSGIPAVDDEVPDILFDRALGYPDLEATTESTRVGYRFEHRFSDSWKIRNAFYHNAFDTLTFGNNGGLPDFTTGTVNLIPSTFELSSDLAEVQTNIVGEFSTGPIEHTLLVGADFYRRRSDGAISAALDPVSFTPLIFDTLNIFDPDFDSLSALDPDTFITITTLEGRDENWGFYLQDQIELLDNLMLLAGVRFDTVYQEQGIQASLRGTNTSEEQRRDAFTPRVGLVYQPVDALSLYTSYSQSFDPNSGVTLTGDLLEPERGEQFEIGARAEVLNGDLVANLALFNINKRNIAITDILNPGFLIDEGGERNRGIELDIIGEILPGWNIAANYAYIDAKITEGEADVEGNRPLNVPKNNVNLWTNYTIQSGSLEGLSFGLGGNFVEDRFGNQANTLTLNDYFLVNAAIGYRRDNWRAVVNFRNLFDVDYIQTSRSDGFALFPGEGFTVIGSFSMTF